MKKLRLSDIATWTGGRLVGRDGEIAAVSTDTRTITPGALFVALRGERHDAHEFVATARERYANVTCVLITASAEALALRLAARARPSDASLDNRIARNSLYAEFAADFVIDNSGTVGDLEAQIEDLWPRLLALTTAPADRTDEGE